MKVLPSLIFSALAFVSSGFARIPPEVMDFDVDKREIPDIFDTMGQTRNGFLQKLLNDVSPSSPPMPSREVLPVAASALLEIMGKYLKKCLTVVAAEEGTGATAFLRRIGRAGFPAMVSKPQHTAQRNVSFAG